MLRHLRTLWKWIAAASLLAGAATSAAQTPQGYPNRPIRIVVPYAAGISPDVVARILADKLSQSLGQPVLIDNRPGASGMIGAEAAARSPADGHTLLMSVTAIMAMNPHIYKKMNYDPLKDFKPVTHVLNVPFVLVAAPGKPFSSVAELLAAARKEPGVINYASLGAGSHSHVAMEWLMAQTGVRLHHVPYRSTPASDIISGAVSVYFDPVVTAMPLIAGQKVKALGISTLKRSAVLPDVPAISETVPGFDTYAFQGIYVPAGTPDSIVERLNSELVKIIRSPEVSRKLAEFGYIPVGSSIEAFQRLTVEEHARYGKLIRDNGIRLD